jgi:drug/metabolite transporter (DMT)-like permease
MAHVYFSLVCLIWGASFILMERISHALGPVEIALCRAFISAVLLGGVWWWRSIRCRITFRDLARIAFAGSLGTGVPFIVQPFCVSQGHGHSYFGILVAFLPLATLIVSIPMLGIWPTPRQLVGVLGGLFCMWAIMADGTLRGIAPRYVAIFMLVPICSAIGNTMINKHLSHLPALPMTTLLLLSVGFVLLPFELIAPLRNAMGFNVPAVPHDWPQALLALAAFILFGTCIAVLLNFKLVQEQGPLFAGMITYVLPIMSLLWGCYDHELITLREVAAMAGVLATIALVQFGTARPTSISVFEASESQSPVPSP